MAVNLKRSSGGGTETVAVSRRRLLGWGLAFLLAGGTLAFQTYLLWDSTSWAGLSAAAAALLLASALALAAASRFSTRLAAPAAAILLTTLLAAPLTWSLLTTFNHSANEQLPAAGPAQQGRMGPGNRSGGNGPTPMDGNGSQAQMQLAANRGSNLTMGPGGGGDNQALLSYLLAHTQTSTYLVATGRAQDAAGYILATGRPVLALGGFLGQYDEFSLDQFKTLVNHGQLRFVLGSALDQHQVISQWVQQNCSLVNDSSVAGTTLYDCEK